MKFFLYGICFYIVLTCQAYAFNCATPNPYSYDKVFLGEVVEVEDEFDESGTVFAEYKFRKATFRVLQPYHGKLGKTEVIHFSQDPLWGPDFMPGDKPVWIYSRCNEFGNRCTTSLCSFGVDPKFYRGARY